MLRLFKRATVEVFKPRTTDVPRDAMGWPSIEPSFFTLPQLCREAAKWRRHVPGTVGAAKWKLYTDELIRRGFSTRVEIEHRRLPTDIYGVMTPDRPEWWHQMEE